MCNISVFLNVFEVVSGINFNNIFCNFYRIYLQLLENQKVARKCYSPL